VVGRMTERYFCRERKEGGVWMGKGKERDLGRG
jgi:hypothetical protein